MSERSVIRIWADARYNEDNEMLKDDASRIAEAMQHRSHWHGTTPEMVQAEVINQVEHLKELRAYYMAMQDAHPTNCAWGNLVMKCNQQINEMLRMKGHWFGLENQREPLSWIGVRNNDYNDELDELRDRYVAAYIDQYRREKGIPDGTKLPLKDIITIIQSMPAHITAPDPDGD